MPAERRSVKGRFFATAKIGRRVEFHTPIGNLPDVLLHLAQWREPLPQARVSMYESVGNGAVALKSQVRWTLS